MPQHRRARRKIAILFCAASAASAAVHASDVTSTWIGPGGATASWSVANNWANTPPIVQYPNNGNGGFTYDAVVNSTGTLLLTETINLNRLTLNAGTLDGSGDLIIHDYMTWIGGGMRGSGTTTILAGATLEMSGTASRRTLTRTINNFGVTNWTNTGVTGDTIAALGTFNNMPGAVFNANCQFSSMKAFGNGSFTNQGLIHKNTATTTRFGGITSFSNTGTVEVHAGTLAFYGQVAQAAGTQTLNGGNWIVDATASANQVQLYLNAPPPLIAIGPATRVELRGANALFGKLLTLEENQGRLNLLLGHKFTTIGPFANSGTTTVGTGNGTVLKVSGSLTNTGTIDVSGGLIVDYTGPTPRPAIEAQIANARHGGAWDQIGITSSAARAATPGITTLGVLESADYIALYGANAPFFGLNNDNTSILVKYTYYGDTDFNGRVDGADYARIDTTFNNEVTTQNDIGAWINGDFDYNGKVDGADYALIDSAFNAQTQALPQLVPEPASALWVLGCGITLARWARQRGIRFRRRCNGICC